ncbi:MAG: hypothetical protein Q9M92_02180 [Enterobacterales bacterium]|nr:hypothetical protein [Enterobacterales bacterium]
MNTVYSASIKTLSFFIITLMLLGCCYNKPIDYSLRKAPSVKELNIETKTHKDYPLNFLACRANINSENNKERQLVNKIVSAVKNSKKQVVLYFHGGLSGQEYMIKDLGPWLMSSMFKNEKVDKAIYPIFVSYDAHPLDTLTKEDKAAQVTPSWTLFKNRTQALLSSNDYKTFEKEAKTFIHYLDSYNEQSKDEKLRNNSIRLLRGVHLVKTSKIQDHLKLTKSEKQQYVDILSNNKVPKILDWRNIGKPRGKGSISPIDDIALKLQILENNYLKTLNKKEATKKTNLKTLKLRVLRILARFALKLDHGFYATWQEEILQVFKIGALGKSHWNKVKQHAKQCFAENSTGRYLIDELVKLKLTNRNLSINTLSHSAGAIPTAELIQYLAENNAKNSLNTVIMLVPAINQSTFNNFVIPSRNIYRKLEVYSLTKEKELNDKVWKKLLYSSSLLYAVSSLAENSPALDNMLLIDQHIKPTTSFYGTKIHQCAVDESPKPIWRFLKRKTGNDTSYDSIFITYPFLNANATPYEGKLDPASHEGTKYPWVSQDLARAYLKTLGIDSKSLKFPIPPSYPKP